MITDLTMNDLGAIYWYRNKGFTTQETALLTNRTEYKITEVEEVLAKANITFKPVSNKNRFTKATTELKHRLGFLSAPKSWRPQTC